MGIWQDLLTFVGLAVGLVIVTRTLLVRGLEMTSKGWGLPPKVQGQVLGYATSVPELVGTVATAWRGLLGAGLWNVAASNIINFGLFVTAALYYRRTHQLVKRKFLDEVGFALGAIALPLALATMGAWARTPWAAALLVAFFITYLVADARLNRPAADEEGEQGPPPRDSQLGRRGLLRAGVGVLCIMVLGHFLGAVAERVVVDIGVPEYAVGWLLGVVTSIPELTSFFTVFGSGSASADDDDCQQNLDNLAASNMSNIGIVYPVGIVIYLLVAG